MLNLNEINLKDLKAIGKELKIKGFSIMRKPDMMAAISDAIDADETLQEVVEQLIEQLKAEAPVKEAGKVKPSLCIKELTFNGKTQSIGAWADEIGLKRPALYDRINRQGWTVEEALTIPAGGRRKAAKDEAQTELAE